MSRHAARIIAVVVVGICGCSANATSENRRPFPADTTTTQEPAGAVEADADVRAPGRKKPPAIDDGTSSWMAPGDAGGSAPEAQETDASVALDAGEPVSPPGADAGGADAGEPKVSDYDPERDDPWSIARKPVPGDHNWCLNSAFVESGHYAGDVGGNSDDYQNPDKCGDYLPSKGRDAWVKVKVPAAQTITVWANVKETGDYDAVLYLLAGSCGKLGTCVAGANENLASREHATWTNDTGTEATVHVVFDLLLPPEKLVETIPYYLDISVR